MRPPDPAGHAVGAGQLRPPHAFDAGFQDLVARGEAHERAVLDGFAGRGWSVGEIATQPDGDAARATVAAMKAGADVVYQGVLLARQGDGPALCGRPDFLVRNGLLPAPDGEKVSDYAAFEGQARRRLAEVVANDDGPLPYPEPDRGHYRAFARGHLQPGGQGP